MVGSPLLYLARHRGPYHAEFTARVFHDPTALTVMVEPRDDARTPTGFLRLFGINLSGGFAFFESALAHPRSLRSGLGVEASRLFLAFAMDVLGLRRVEVKIYAYNVLSINAVTRNGFVREGVLRQARSLRPPALGHHRLLHSGHRNAGAAHARFPQDFGFWPSDARP
jgi:RimJ/RimL family protein N-acetyltransferase